MKILFIIHSLNIGGAETIVTKYASKLKEMGHDVALLEFAHIDSYLYVELEKKQVKVLTATPLGMNRLWNSLYTRLLLSRKVNRLIRQVAPDVVHIHTYNRYVNITSIEPTRIFYTLHCTYDGIINNLPHKSRAKYIEFLKSGVNVIALSEIIKKSIKNATSIDDIIVLPNGLDINKIAENKYKKDFLEKYGVQGDSFVVGHVGRFNVVKNHYKLFEIFSKIKNESNNAVLVLVGTGIDSEKKQIVSFMDQFGIKDSVVLLGLRKDAPSIIGAFDVFILPSKSEAFPLVAIEAQANGTRCLFSDVVPEELVVNNNCFRLSIETDSEEWARLALSDEIVNRDRNIMNYDIGVVMSKHLDLYYSKLKSV